MKTKNRRQISLQKVSDIRRIVTKIGGNIKLWDCSSATRTSFDKLRINFSSLSTKLHFTLLALSEAKRTEVLPLVDVFTNRKIEFDVQLTQIKTLYESFGMPMFAN